MKMRSKVRHVALFVVMAGVVLGSVVLDPSTAMARPAPSMAPVRAHAALPFNVRYIGVMQAAGSMLGHPYRWGGASPGGFDCSGLVRWSFATSGRNLPHSSRSQRAVTTPIRSDQAAAGDLVFFGSPVHHVGIYMGGGYMIHAPNSGGVVEIKSIHSIGSTPRFGRVK